MQLWSHEQKAVLTADRRFGGMFEHVPRWTWLQNCPERSNEPAQLISRPAVCPPAQSPLPQRRRHARNKLLSSRAFPVSKYFQYHRSENGKIKVKIKILFIQALQCTFIKTTDKLHRKLPMVGNTK